MRLFFRVGLRRVFGSASVLLRREYVFLTLICIAGKQDIGYPC